MTENDLSARQKRFLQALLNSKSAREAARKVKVGEKTAYRWLRQPAFREALAEAEADLLEAATRRLLALQASALDAVGAVLADEHLPPTYRLSAARLVLDSALRFYDVTSLERRLKALEEEVRRVAAQGGAPGD
jgi:hypothetical protein